MCSPFPHTGAATVFVLDTGSVQLVPQVSLVPIAKFTAFVVLNNSIKSNEGEVVYNCHLNAVNDSSDAKQLAENPVCKAPDEAANRPAEPINPGRSICDLLWHNREQVTRRMFLLLAIQYNCMTKGNIDPTLCIQP